jgi:hypothetical protein
MIEGINGTPGAYVIQEIISNLDQQLGAHVGADVTDNLRALHSLSSAVKLELEARLSGPDRLVFLSDDEVRQIRTKISELTAANTEVCERQGLDSEKILFGVE